MKSLQADFFKVMKEGAIQYAAPLPFLDLVCVGTATQTEVEEQVDLMYSLIHQQVDAIVLVPIDSKALVQPVVEAVRKGVPVINIDIRLDTQLLEQAGVEVAFVGPDNFAAAYEVGKLLDKKLRNEDKVAIIEGLAAAVIPVQRAMSDPVSSAPLAASGTTAIPSRVNPSSLTSLPHANVYPFFTALSITAINSSSGRLYDNPLRQLSWISMAN